MYRKVHYIFIFLLNIMCDSDAFQSAIVIMLTYERLEREGDETRLKYLKHNFCPIK
jgi:hypothetical protein